MVLARKVTYDAEENDTLLWFLFSAGGTVAALLFPLHVLVTGLLIPLGWIDVPGYDSVVSLVSHPLARAYLFVLISLPLFPRGASLPLHSV